MEPLRNVARPRDMSGLIRRLPVVLGASTTVIILLASCGGAHASDAAGTDSGAPRATSHVDGTVVAGPRCPVDRAERPCHPRPVPGALVQLIKGSRVVAHGLTHQDGTFRLRGRPGSYVVRATNVGNYRSTVSRPVVLRTGSTTTVRLLVDTGIR